MKNLLYTIVLTLLSTASFGQQVQQTSLFSDAKGFWNPAFIGNGDALSVNAYINQQWFTFGGNTPRNIKADLQYPFVNMNMSAGATLAYDRVGPINKTTFGASYAYHVKELGRNNGRLSLGLAGTANIFSIDLASEVVKDQGDPTLSNRVSKFYPSIKAGVFYISNADQYNENTSVYIGLSGYQLLETNLFVTEQINVKRVRGFNADFGVKFYQYRSMIEPMISVNYSSPDFVHALVGVNYELKDFMWFGLGYHTSQSMAIQAGYIIPELGGRDTRLKMGINAGLPMSIDRIIDFGPSAELFLRYEFDQY